MALRPGSATVTLPNDTDILITRTFEAPRSLVWQALTEARHILRWWGPSWCPITSCEVDLRVGGHWRYVCTMDDGTELGWHGEYLAITPGEGVVSTEVFEGFPDAVSTNTMTLTEHEGVTTMQTLVHHTEKAFRDGHIDSGMEGGMQETFNRLDDLLAASGSIAEQLRRVSGRFADRLAEVPADAWDNPAPCEGWVARDVVRHVVDWIPSVISRGGVLFPVGPSVADDPTGAWAAVDAALQGALDDPEVAAHTFDVGPPGQMSVEAAIGMIVTGDLLIHTWDLAAATGLERQLDPIMVANMYVGIQPFDDMLRSSGHYGPKFELPADLEADADVQTRLIAFTGRNPYFGPAARS